MRDPAWLSLGSVIGIQTLYEQVTRVDPGAAGVSQLPPIRGDNRIAVSGWRLGEGELPRRSTLDWQQMDTGGIATGTRESQPFPVRRPRKGDSVRPRNIRHFLLVSSQWRYQVDGGNSAKSAS